MQAYKVVVIGDAGVGKSSLINRFQSKRYSALPQDAATDGDFVAKQLKVGKQILQLQLWEHKLAIAGNLEFYRNAHACILIYNLDSKNSFQNLESWCDEFWLQSSNQQSELFPIVVLGHKADSSCRQITKKRAEQWCRGRQITYMETSAVNGMNVENAFKALARKILEYYSNIILDEEDDTSAAVKMENRLEPVFVEPIKKKHSKLSCLNCFHPKQHDD